MNGRITKVLRKAARKKYEEDKIYEKIGMPFKSFFRKVKKNYTRRTNE